MKLFDVLRRQLHNSDAAAQSLREVVAGLAGQTRMLDNRLQRIAALLARNDGAGLSAPAASTAAPSGAENGTSPVVVGEIPFPRIDIGKFDNPIPAIAGSHQFAAAVRWLQENPGSGRSLVTEAGRALLYALIRNQKPRHAVEIGTFRGGTTEVMARAMLENGAGTLYTVGPFDAEAFIPVYNSWPRELQQLVCFYPTDSMAFFMEMEALAIKPDLVFIDGNHDYEFVLFDLLCAARRLTPRGFIILDDANQAGPYCAAQDFLAQDGDWIDCAGPDLAPRDRTKAFDPARTHVSGTNFVVLRSPAHYRLVPDRPHTFGEIPWPRPEAGGVALSLDGCQGPGIIHLQCILRGFGDAPAAQVCEAGSLAVEEGARNVKVRLSQPVVVTEPVARCTLEPWLIWAGKGPLRLKAIPSPF
jgi:predicted O-methyltransferase YrrM